MSAWRSGHPHQAAGPAQRLRGAQSGIGRPSSRGHVNGDNRDFHQALLQWQVACVPLSDTHLRAGWRPGDQWFAQMGLTKITRPRNARPAEGCERRPRLTSAACTANRPNEPTNERSPRKRHRRLRLGEGTISWPDVRVVYALLQICPGKTHGKLAHFTRLQRPVSKTWRCGPMQAFQRCRFALQSQNPALLSFAVTWTPCLGLLYAGPDPA